MRKNSGNILLLILAVIGIVAASIGGYFWWASQKPKPEPIVEIKSKEAIPSTGLSLNLKTWTNLNYKVRLEIPNNWEATMEKYGDDPICYPKSENPPLPGCRSTVFIQPSTEIRILTLMTVPSNGTLINSFANEGLRIHENYSLGFGGKKGSLELRDQKIGNKNGLAMYGKGSDLWSMLFVEHSGDFYIFKPGGPSDVFPVLNIVVSKASFY